MRFHRMAVLIAATLTLAGCGTADSLDTEAAAGPTPSPASNTAFLEPSEAFPTASISDWVSYPTQLSVVVFSDERELPREAELAETGEGYLGRVLQAQIESTVWRNPDDQPLPDEFDMRVYGWMVAADGTRVPVQAAGSPRLEMGKRYLVPLTRFFGDIGPLSSHSVALLGDADRLVLSPGQRDAVVEEFTGRTTREVAAAVRSARPDALAKKYKHLPPYERVQAVLRERSS